MLGIRKRAAISSALFLVLTSSVLLTLNFWIIGMWALTAMLHFAVSQIFVGFLRRAIWYQLWALIFILFMPMAGLLLTMAWVFIFGGSGVAFISARSSLDQYVFFALSGLMLLFAVFDFYRNLDQINDQIHDPVRSNIDFIKGCLNLNANFEYYSPSWLHNLDWLFYCVVILYFLISYFFGVGVSIGGFILYFLTYFCLYHIYIIYELIQCEMRTDKIILIKEFEGASN